MDGWGRWMSLALIGLNMVLPAKLQAILFMTTADPEYNTTSPTGELANSGWDWQGFWGGFLGTPIGPHHFITARHVGGALGDKFVLNGVEHSTRALFDDPSSDLRIWEITDSFVAFAPLYNKTNEIGQRLIVFGRGTQRGAPVIVDRQAGAQLQGWQWGPADGRKRWGENQVASIENDDELISSGDAGRSRLGDLLKATFDAEAGPDEAHLSVGDSGGAVFIQDAGAWKLAGLNYGVDGPYSLFDSGPGFNAALFDQGGVFTEEDGQWTLTPVQATAQPGAFYSTRISVHLDWINDVLSGVTPETPVLQWANAVAGPYADDASAAVDTAARKISIAAPGVTRFYRLQASSALRINSITLAADRLVLQYE